MLPLATDEDFNGRVIRGLRRREPNISLPGDAIGRSMAAWQCGL
jgi:hypothetical protein